MALGVFCQSECEEELSQRGVQRLIGVTQLMQADHLHKFTLDV